MFLFLFLFESLCDIIFNFWCSFLWDWAGSVTFHGRLDFLLCVLSVSVLAISWQGAPQRRTLGAQAHAWCLGGRAVLGINTSSQASAQPNLASVWNCLFWSGFGFGATPNGAHGLLLALCSDPWWCTWELIQLGIRPGLLPARPVRDCLSSLEFNVFNLF